MRVIDIFAEFIYIEIINWGAGLPSGWDWAYARNPCPALTKSIR